MAIQPVHRFRLDLDALDLSVLPEHARQRGTRAFRDALRVFLEGQFADWGGWRTISIDDRGVEVVWTAEGVPPDPLEQILDKLRAGDYHAGITLLQLLLSDRPDDVAVLYNLGMALSDMGRLPEAERHLRHALRFAPDEANILVALGVALVRGEKLDEGIEVLARSAEVEPDNPWAHRNLAAVLGKSGRMDEALAAFRRAIALNPDDQQAWLGLAGVLEQTGKKDEADEALRRVVEIDEHSRFADAARDRRNRIAYENFRRTQPSGERMDAVFYCLGALQKFSSMPRAEVQQIVSEIALLGMKGLDVNDSTQKYRLHSLPGEFSGLHLVSIEYTGFQMIDSSVNVGFDLAREYAAARALFESKKPDPIH